MPTASLPNWSEVDAGVDGDEGVLDGTDRLAQDASFDPGTAPGIQFVENQGQAGAEGGSLYLRASHVSMSFHPDHVRVMVASEGDGQGRTWHEYRIRFLDANIVEPSGVKPTGTTYNYFIGDDPSGWRSDVRGYTEVAYEGLWDGIDLVYKVVESEIKYDLIVWPGGSPSSVRLSYEGIEGLVVSPSSGDLVIDAGGTTVRDESPTSYQEAGGSRSTVESEFALLDATTVGFRVGPYDDSVPLVIDPRLIFSTFLGSDGYDNTNACFVDRNGDIYLLGTTSDDDFPVTNSAYDSSHNGNYDAYVSKISANGSKLLYSTFIGGSSNENYMAETSWRTEAGGIWVDDSGAVFITGNTASNDFPTTAGAYDRNMAGSYDCFVSKLSPRGNKLNFSTYLGDNSNDFASDLCVDGSGNVIVVGYTYGTFPTTTGAYDTTWGGRADGFVAMLNASGDKLLHSTHLGSTSDDVVFSVALDTSDIVHVTGYTRSYNFPTTNGSYDTSHNGYSDIFVVKLNETFGKLHYSTLVGSTYYDYGFDVVVDEKDRAYVAGAARRSNFPVVSGCYDTSYSGDADGVVFRLSSNGSKLERSTFYGYTRDDWPMAIDISPTGDIVFAGYTEYYVPTTSDAYHTSNQGYYDAFVGTFDPNLTKLLYGSMFGSLYYDYAWDVWSYGDRNTSIVIGDTGYSDFPTTKGAYDTSHGGNYDGFIMRLGEPFSPYWVNVSSYHAIEDVPLVIPLHDNVVDPDTATSALTINSTSPYLVKAKDLNATFLFPNGVLNASIPVNVSDLYSSSTAMFNFTVQPVNDPPVCNLTKAIYAVEEIPQVVNLTKYTWDEDTDLADLRPEYDSEYLTHDGLVITALFPDGISSYEAVVNITDGESGTEVLLRFVVYPVDDPPSIDPLPTFNATEDTTSIFDLTPYIHDPDTPLYQLRITATGSDCTVVGQQLHFLFKSPKEDHYVTIIVSDICTMVSARMRVHVMEYNDPPRVSNVPTLEFVEDTSLEVDLSPYVSDEDTELSLLSLECDHYACLSTSGLRMTMLYTTEVLDHRVEFTVVDGERRRSGSFLAHVTPVNDPPRLDSLEGMEPPIVIQMMEDRMAWFSIHVTDEDSTSFTYSLEESWEGLTVYQNGSLRAVATGEDVGERTAVLVIDDNDGGQCREELRIVVENVNDPPRVVKVGGSSRPFTITVDEDTEAWFKTVIEDEDSTSFSYSIEPAWDAIEVLGNGTIRVTATADDIGERTVTLVVEDMSGGLTEAKVIVVVRGVNDLPEIRRIGDAEPPFEVIVDERTNTLLTITVYDEEATGIYYTLVSDWDGVIVLQNGTLSIVAGSDDIGTHPVTLSVEDADGGIASVDFSIVVTDVNDPPGKIFVLSPASGSSVTRGTNVTFSVDVRDPDMEMGQEVTVVWTSSIDGELRSMTGSSGFIFTTSELAPGEHVITITASDGMLESRTTIELTVREPTTDGGGAGLTGENTYLVLMLVVLAILVLVTLGLIYMGRKQDELAIEGKDGGGG